MMMIMVYGKFNHSVADTFQLLTCDISLSKSD